jgi:hypothetical protein
MELVGTGTHIEVLPGAAQTAKFNAFTNVQIEGTSKAYTFGDGTGGSIASTTITGGRSSGAWFLGSEVLDFHHPIGDIIAHAALVPGSGLLTDNGTRTDIDLSGSLSDSFGITGLTTTPAAGFLYGKRGGIVTISIPTLNGTSNTTACTLTGIPAEVRPDASKVVPVRIQNNGTITMGIGTVDSSGVITLSPADGSGTFVGSGSKGVIATEISYQVKG